MLCPLQGKTLVKKPVTGPVALNVYKQKTPRLLWELRILLYRSVMCITSAFS